MNQIAIAIKLNERQVIIGARWWTKQTFKVMARFELNRLKQKVCDIALDVAMAIIPMPSPIAA